MTDDLVQLWRDGDPMAATAVRNALRGIADAVLTSPTGQPGGAVALADADRRRDATAAVAKEVMQRGGSSADELRGLAVMVSARHAVVEARAGDPASGVDSHLPPQLVVSVALAPDSLSSHARGVAERHLHDCPSCTGEVDLVLRVVKGLTMPRPVAPAGTAAASAGTAAASAGTAAASAGTAAAPVAPAAVEAPVAPVAPGPRAGAPTPPSPALAPRPPTTSTAPGASARAASGPVRPPRGGRLDRRTTLSWFEALWPLVAILVVLAVVMSLRARRMEAAQAQPAVAVLADRSPPAVPAADGLPGDASSALVDLERGQCDLAAARLRTSRLRNPQVVELALLEAGTWVCAGDGARAEEASQAYLQGGGQTNAELLWVQAQAALLRGEATHARDRLVRLRPLVDLERGARIDEQLAGLRSL